MTNPNDTKLQILNSANEIFYHKGYHNTGFSDIENKTGLSRGNITYHFKTKRNILNEVIRMRLQRITSSLEQCDLQASCPQEAIIYFCEEILNNKKDIVKYGCHVGTLTTEVAKNDKDLYDLTLPMFKAYKTWLTNKHADMGLSKKEAQEKALEILARVQGIALIAHTFRDSGFLKNEIQKLKKEYS
jgi:AcrR family transcriptional regulator